MDQRNKWIVGTDWFVVFGKRYTASGKEQRIVGDKNLVGAAAGKKQRIVRDKNLAGAAAVTLRRTHEAWGTLQMLWRIGGMIVLDPGDSYGEEVEVA